MPLGNTVRDIPALLFDTGSITQTANGTSATFNYERMTESAIVAVKVTAVSGTNPTLTLGLNVVDDYGDNIATSTFSQSAVGKNAAQVTVLGQTPFFWGTALQVAWTIGGVTPSFTFQVKVYVQFAV